MYVRALSVIICWQLDIFQKVIYSQTCVKQPPKESTKVAA